MFSVLSEIKCDWQKRPPYYAHIVQRTREKHCYSALREGW